MRPPVKRAIEDHFGCAITTTRAVLGGDINESFAITLSTGTSLFIKSNQSANRGLFPAESYGLRWLEQANALRTPAVVAHSTSEADPSAAFLALELIESGPKSRDFASVLGRGLAKLHQTQLPEFGLKFPNFIGILPQDNTTTTSWAEFYAYRRIEPQVQLGRDNGHFSSQDAIQFTQLCESLPDLVGDQEPPAMLHGDLWSGNIITDEHGAPTLIDPAVYAGHREMDLAMMRLFGGFSEETFDAYNDFFPLAPNTNDRLPLYQLYPILVHVNLFGGSYIPQAKSILNRYI